MSYKKILILMVVFFLGSAAVVHAASIGKHDPWSDNRSNDVLVKQTAIVEIFTSESGGGKNKNFKWSFSRPYDIWPDHWCVNVSNDVHSDQIGNFPYVQCFDTPETASIRLRNYVKQFGISLHYDFTNMDKK